MNNLFPSRRLLATAPIWVLAGVLLSAAPSRADEPERIHRRMANRFLFVVDTSSAMRPRTNGVEKTLVGLIESGMNGELRPNDTIGLWTYGERLNTDFPMLVWSEKSKDALADQVRDYLGSLHYEKRSRLESVLPALGPVMADSERLTVIFVFDGSGVMRGTRFDKDINALHKKYAREFRAAHEPVVTVLAARDGVVFDYTINYPGTVIVPHTADPLPPPETNAPPVAVQTPPPPPVEPTPPPRGHDIILSGTNLAKPPSVAPPATEVAAIVTPAPVTHAPPPPAVTNAPAPAPPPPAAVQVTNTTDATNTTIASAAPVEPPRAPLPAAHAAPAPVPVAATVPAPAPGSQLAMFIMAFSLLTIAVVLVLFLVRRSRGASQSSLISQSIDRSR